LCIGERWVSWLEESSSSLLIQLRDSAGLPEKGTGFPFVAFASGRKTTFTDIQLDALSIDICPRRVK
jgi:hypothetical protein